MNFDNNFEFLPSIKWKQKELLSEEFKSLVFIYLIILLMNIKKFLIN